MLEKLSSVLYFSHIYILLVVYCFFTSPAILGSQKEIPLDAALKNTNLVEVVSVRNIEGPATRVRGFTTPDDSKIRKSPNRKGSIPTPSLRKVILVIEDSPLVKRIFSELFSRIRKDSSHYELIFSETGEEGINLYITYSPILTFVDCHLAGLINGDEVIKNIIRHEICLANMRKEKPSEGFDPLLTPPINPSILVAFSNDDNQNNLMVQLGAHHKMTKPIQYNVFTDTLAHLLPPIEEKLKE